MKTFEVPKIFGVLLTLCFLGMTKAQMTCLGPGESISAGKCLQSCELNNECVCNATGGAVLHSCGQICDSLTCLNELTKISCSAEENCIQTCEPGTCAMTCQAQQFCGQRATHGVKNMSCLSAKVCTQNCAGGGCEMMHCDSKICIQQCGQGGCTMNCTENVEVCSQTCSSNEKCVLECRAQVCQQECSGPKQCIILNAGSSRVYLSSTMFFAAFLLLALQQP